MKDTVATEIKIIIDDADREMEPERPWTANAYDSDGDVINTTFGATISEAISNLVNETIWANA
jgi:hypothetical protein